MSYNRQCQAVVDKYRKHFGHDPVDMMAVAEWAHTHNLIERRKVDIVRQIARDLAKAEGAEHMLDPQLRSVRRNHAVRTKQGTLWAEIDKAPAEHMHMSAQQRRLGIVDDAEQLETDTNSWNDNYRKPVDSPIQLSFDLTKDLKERKLSTEYREERPDEDEDEPSDD
jgi:hypothetical protein